MILGQCQLRKERFQPSFFVLSALSIFSLPIKPGTSDESMPAANRLLFSTAFSFPQ
jgi:hypothetical protein